MKIHIFDTKLFAEEIAAIYGRKHTKLERTNINDEQITNRLWDIFEHETAKLLSTT